MKELAESCHVSLKDTVGSMRMRLFELLQAALGAFRYGPTVSCQADGLYLDESLTGNRDKVGHPDAEGGTRTAM